MALKKSDLYSSLWKGADELRGGMDASQYKDYILTLLFVKYVSDKFIGDKEALVVVPEGVLPKVSQSKNRGMSTYNFGVWYFVAVTEGNGVAESSTKPSNGFK